MLAQNDVVLAPFTGAAVEFEPASGKQRAQVFGYAFVDGARVPLARGLERGAAGNLSRRLTRGLSDRALKTEKPRSKIAFFRGLYRNRSHAEHRAHSLSIGHTL